MEVAEEFKAQFGQDGIAFMLTCETDVRRIHQDFADCSKTKQIPPSLLTSYDLRQPANGLVMDVIDQCAIFNRNKVDSTSKNVGKNSLKLFVTNQVRQMIKTLLTGDMALSEPAFVEKARTLLPDDVVVKQSLEKIKEFLKILTEEIPVWKEAAEISGLGPEANRLKALREKQSLAFTATGLNIIGLIGHELLFNGGEIKDWRQYATKLGKLNYAKSDPLWKDVLTEKLNKAGEKVWHIQTQRSPVERATARAKQEIGLEPELNLAPAA
jgi:DNA sulfur modification protein DndB